MRKIELKQKATKSLLAIVFFILSYLLLTAAAIALTIGCLYAGIAIIAWHPGVWTIMIGLGLIGMGGLVLFFLLKFLFKRNKTDRSGMVEIFEKEEPKLFALVRELSTEIKTSFPKHIYLTPDVNASVFYDSGFWSMFVPTSKNLQIGLGLVNSVTESELKAILAHEFGHFSQKSMSIGSYVYNVNHVIYNLLNDNESYNSIVQDWANVSDYFAIFAAGAIKIVQGIKWILVKLYSVVNISYMELSREMEFEADEIAAYVAGSKPLIDSLLRLDFSDTSYRAVLDYYGAQIAENRNTDNIFPQHSFIMDEKAKVFQLSLANGLPFVSIDTVKRMDKSQLVIKNQWASHPSDRERVERLESLGVVKGLQNGSAWNFFQDKEKTQQQLTQKLFEAVQYKESPSPLNLEAFCMDYTEKEKSNAFPSIYNSFYNQRDIAQFDMGEPTGETVHLEALFSEENLELVKELSALLQDIQSLEHIEKRAWDVKTFDYAGTRYTWREAAALRKKLELRRQEVETELKEVDKQSYAYFLNVAKASGKEAELKAHYTAYFGSEREYELDITLYSQFVESIDFMQRVTPYDEINKRMQNVYQHEGAMRERLSELLKEADNAQVLDKDTREKVDTFLSQKWSYFIEPDYNNPALELLYTAMNSFLANISQRVILKKRKLLQFQAELVG